MRTHLRLDTPPHPGRKGQPVSTPLYTLGTAVVFVIVGAVLLVTGVGKEGNGLLLLGFIVSTLPSLVASAFSERVSRDVRNGTVMEKAKEGARKALDETGVTQAVVEGQSTTPAALAALTKLLEQNTSATQANTAAHEQEGERP